MCINLTILWLSLIEHTICNKSYIASWGAHVPEVAQMQYILISEVTAIIWLRCSARVKVASFSHLTLVPHLKPLAFCLPSDMAFIALQLTVHAQLGYGRHPNTLVSLTRSVLYPQSVLLRYVFSACNHSLWWHQSVESRHWLGKSATCRHMHYCIEMECAYATYTAGTVVNWNHRNLISVSLHMTVQWYWLTLGACAGLR